MLKVRHGVLTGVTKSMMPEVNVGGGKQGGVWSTARRAQKRVELPFTIAAKDHTMSLQVLHRKPASVKFNRTKIVTGELTNREQIAN
jgi:hypothetical protein